MESEDSGGSLQPLYIVPCRNYLSKSQKKIVEERVQAIQSEVPICVAVMKNNNVGDAQKWMLVSSAPVLVLNIIFLCFKAVPVIVKLHAC